MTRLEDRQISEILAFFEARQMPLIVEPSRPIEPTPDELRRMPGVVRRELRKRTSGHWVSLGTTSRWYGYGESEEQAIRNAARRYRVEQADPEASD